MRKKLEQEAAKSRWLFNGISMFAVLAVTSMGTAAYMLVTTNQTTERNDERIRVIDAQQVEIQRDIAHLETGIDNQSRVLDRIERHLLNEGSPR